LVARRYLRIYLSRKRKYLMDRVARDTIKQLIFVRENKMYLNRDRFPGILRTLHLLYELIGGIVCKGD
jgi:hypothetical protein